VTVSPSIQTADDQEAFPTETPPGEVPEKSGRDLAQEVMQAYLGRHSFADGPVEIAAVGEASTAAKTTTAATWAAMLAMLGFTVDLIDLDGQGDAGVAYGIGVSQRPDDNLLDVRAGFQPPLVVADALLSREATLPDPADPEQNVRRKVRLSDVRRSVLNQYGVPGFGVITNEETGKETLEWLSRIFIYPSGSSYVMGSATDPYEDQVLIQQNPFGVTLLGMQVAQLDADLAVAGQGPHFRIYDTHGTKGWSMMAALLRVQSAFTCCVPDDKTTAVHLDELIGTVAQVKAGNPGLNLTAIVPCKVKSGIQRGKHGQAMLDRLRERHGALVYPGEIREKVTVSEAYTNREPLPMWVPGDAATDDYWRALAWAFDRGVFGSPK
jgi:cellulose biosynthesis protein BcsQ